MEFTPKQLELKLCPIGWDLLAQEHPVEKSKAGTNVVFHYCDPLGYRASYAGCLHTMDAVAEGRGHLRPDCQAEIECRTCPARAMRLQELKANRALFYVDYHQLMERRGLQVVQDREQSPVQFRRKRDQRAFVPTKVAPMPVRDPQPLRNKVVVKPMPKPRVEQDDGYNTDIMKQVLEKQVEDDRQGN